MIERFLEKRINSMESLIKIVADKLSAYEIINNIFPGSVFCYLVSKTTRFSFSGKNIWEDIIIYYFVGIIVGRIGSLLLEKVLIKSRLVKFCDYTDYINAEKEDEKISDLSTKNNMYRSLMSVGICGLGVIVFDIGYGWLINYGTCVKVLSNILICTFIATIFMLAYIKQTNYVRYRIEKNIKCSNCKSENK